MLSLYQHLLSPGDPSWKKKLVRVEGSLFHMHSHQTFVCILYKRKPFYLTLEMLGDLELGLRSLKSCPRVCHEVQILPLGERQLSFFLPCCVKCVIFVLMTTQFDRITGFFLFAGSCASFLRSFILENCYLYIPSLLLEMQISQLLPNFTTQACLS